MGGDIPQSGDVINTTHFTLHATRESTKKQSLRLAFGARAGRATARNRAKRQARESFQIHRDRLPEAIRLVVRNRGDISALTRRDIRDQLGTLFSRAAGLAPARHDTRTEEK